MTTHQVVSKGAWAEARKRLLAKEKKLPACVSSSARSAVRSPAYRYLDLVPEAATKRGLPHTMAWMKLRDVYDR